jgi:hypothetical protein
MRAVLDSRDGVLRFPALFPGIDAKSPMVTTLNSVVRSRTRSTQPAHKRIDGRRARVTSIVREREWSLSVAIRGANAQYAVQRTLNLINELFVALHESYPDNLIERFGLSAE